MTPRGWDLTLAVLIVSSPAVLWPLGLLWWALGAAVVAVVLLGWRAHRRRGALRLYRRRLLARREPRETTQVASVRVDALGR